MLYFLYINNMLKHNRISNASKINLQDFDRERMYAICIPRKGTRKPQTHHICAQHRNLHQKHIQPPRYARC